MNMRPDRRDSNNESNDATDDREHTTQISSPSSLIQLHKNEFVVHTASSRTTHKHEPRQKPTKEEEEEEEARFEFAWR